MKNCLMQFIIIGDLVISKDIREITPHHCKDYIEDKNKSLRLDLLRGRFILNKKLRTIAGSRRLGNLWLVLDPIFISLIYYFVFTVIRHKSDPESVFIGLTYIRILQMALKHGYINSIDYSGGIKIERVRTRALIFSEFFLGFSNTFFMCLGISILFITFFEIVDPLSIILFYLIGFISYFFWYSMGSLFSPIGLRIPDTNTLVVYFGLMMFFGSPALYPLGATTGIHRTINLYNPFSFCVEPMRNLLIGTEDYLLLNPNIGYFYFGIMIIALAYTSYRFDNIRWRISSWS